MTGRPATRPNPLDPGICDQICERLIGGESLTAICQDQDMPAETMVYRATAANESFGRAIARARELQQDAEVERCVQMADAATVDDWPVVKLRIWARQWRAAKLAPKKYGDRIDVAGDIAVSVTVRRFDEIAAENTAHLIEHQAFSPAKPLKSLEPVRIIDPERPESAVQQSEDEGK